MTEPGGWTPDEDTVERLHARARREQPEKDADDGNRYRAATDSPPRALSSRPNSSQDTESAHDERDDRRTSGYGREDEPEGEHAECDAQPTKRPCGDESRQPFVLDGCGADAQTGDLLPTPIR